MSDSRTEYWGSVGTAWSRGHPQRLWRAHSDAENRALLARWLPLRCGRILKTDAFDEAFGEGLVPVLAERAEEVWMIDLSATVVAEARRSQALAHGAVADVRRLPFSTGSFGAVVSISTLDHLDSLADIEESLREIRRVLEPGGCLVVTLDNPENPVVGLRNFLPWPWLHRFRLSHCGSAWRRGEDRTTCCGDGLPHPVSADRRGGNDERGSPPDHRPGMWC